MDQEVYQIEIAAAMYQYSFWGIAQLRAQNSETFKYETKELTTPVRRSVCVLVLFYVKGKVIPLQARCGPEGG